MRNRRNILIIYNSSRTVCYWFLPRLRLSGYTKRAYVLQLCTLRIDPIAKVRYSSLYNYIFLRRDISNSAKIGLSDYVALTTVHFHLHEYVRILAHRQRKSQAHPWTAFESRKNSPLASMIGHMLPQVTTYDSTWVSWRDKVPSVALL